MLVNQLAGTSRMVVCIANTPMQSSTNSYLAISMYLASSCSEYSCDSCSQNTVSAITHLARKTTSVHCYRRGRARWRRRWASRWSSMCWTVGADDIPARRISEWRCQTSTWGSTSRPRPLTKCTCSKSSACPLRTAWTFRRVLLMIIMRKNSIITSTLANRPSSLCLVLDPRYSRSSYHHTVNNARIEL